MSTTGTKFESSHDPKKTISLCNKSDNSMLQWLDPETLEPIGMARQSVLHPKLKGPTSAAHAKICAKTGDVYNYNLEFGKTGTYHVFHVSASTGKCSILATFPARPAYLHSMFLTESYAIVCVWNSHFSAGGVSILWTRNYLDALSNFDASKPTMWYVIDRTPPDEGGKGLVATYESDPFFAFHTINAYENPDKSITADVCAYDSLDVLKRFYIEHLMSDSPSAKAYSDSKYDNARAYLRRFKLPPVPSQPNTTPIKAENIMSSPKGLAPELPSLNNVYRARKHRYVYGVTDTGKSTFFDGLVKYDMDTLKPVATWSVFGQSAGEPIFIQDPEKEGEDDGVLLTAVLDGTAGHSYLMCLDAKTMTEIGRASLDGVVGFGFHGTHVSTRAWTLGMQSTL